jgi:hypothetical protein
VNTLHLHGIISETNSGYCQIANPIYERILLAAFRSRKSRLQADILVNGYDFRPHITGSKLQMKALLSRFGEFVERRGPEAFTVTPMPREATGQYLLMAYLDLVVRQVGGDLFTEVDSGEGRMALIVVHQGERYIVEAKIWHGKVEFDLVLFHARPRVYGKLTHKELEFTLSHIMPCGYNSMTMHVYLVRLGHILSSKSKSQ